MRREVLNAPKIAPIGTHAVTKL